MRCLVIFVGFVRLRARTSRQIELALRLFLAVGQARYENPAAGIIPAHFVDGYLDGFIRSLVIFAS